MMAVFRILLPSTFYRFSGFTQDVTSRTHARTVVPRDHLQLEEYMTNLVSGSRYLGHNGCQADYEKLKMTLKVKTISQLSLSWNNILTLDCGPAWREFL